MCIFAKAEAKIHKWSRQKRRQRPCPSRPSAHPKTTHLVRSRLKDTYRHKGMRRKLVQTLRRRGITDPRVLAAIGAIPRHCFLDSAFEEKAYEDIALPIDCNQTISQPYTVAYQTQLLEVKPGHKVLEIGTGSGYQAAVLAAMGAEVYTIERHRTLYEQARARIGKLGIKGIHFFHGDGYKGLPQHAPFDRILVTAGAPELPRTLLKQLKAGGIMVVPVGKTVQEMQRITRLDEDTFKKETFGHFRFVPFVPGSEEAE